jgi:hypothetical protein
MSKRFIYGLMAAAGLLVAGYFYGHTQYKRGVQDERVRQELAHARLEEGLRYERDKADARYRAAVAAREVVQADLDSVQRELERVLKDLRNAEHTTSSDRLNAASAARLRGYRECVAEYGALARDAARWADQVNGLQDYIRGVTGH